MTMMPIETAVRGSLRAAELHPLLAGRRSSRAFDARRALDPGALDALLEAARWAPSAGNSQPWRFGVGRRGEPAYEALLEALNPGNRVWAGDAGALMLVASETVDSSGGPRPHAGYDTGQAVAHLTVQAQALGLSVHQMGGFDPDRASRAFTLPEHVVPLVVVAIGHHDPDRELPEPFASREQAPRVRRPLDELVLTPTEAPLPLSA